MRGSSVRGARRLARGGVREQYGEHGEQAQRGNGGPIVCFARQAVRNAGRLQSAHGSPAAKLLKTKKVATRWR